MNSLEFVTALGRTSAQASLLTLLVLFIGWVFRRQLPSRWRSALWLLVMARLLLPISFSSDVSIFNLVPHRHAADLRAAQPNTAGDATQITPTELATPTPVTFAPTPDTMKEPMPLQPIPVANPFATGSQLVTVPEQSQTTISWPTIVFAVWLAGAALLSLHLLIVALRLSRRFRNLQPVRDPAILAVLEECRAALKVQTRLLLVESPDLPTPALHGVFQPRLIMPRGLNSAFTRQELRFVFLHELAHIKRRDVALGWWVAAMQIIHWFNPVLWLGFSRWRLDRELACDALALEAAGPDQNKAYGRTILHLLDNLRTSPAAPGLVGILEDQHQLKQRIEMITTFDSTKPARWLLVLVTGGLTLVCLTDAQPTERVPMLSPEVAPASTSNQPPAIGVELERGPNAAAVKPTASQVSSAEIASSVASNSVITIDEEHRRLSDRDMADIRAIALTNAATPWLITGGQHTNDNVGTAANYVEVYCAPFTNSIADLRRGTILIAMRNAAVGAASQPWRVVDRQNYAQVALPGRSLDQINGAADSNQPFWVTGQFTDAELISLCKLVRSNPVWAGPNGRVVVDGSRPIVSVQPMLGFAARRLEEAGQGSADEMVGVHMRTHATSGQWLSLRFHEGEWSLLGVGFWAE